MNKIENLKNEIIEQLNKEEKKIRRDAFHFVCKNLEFNRIDYYNQTGTFISSLIKEITKNVSGHWCICLAERAKYYESKDKKYIIAECHYYNGVEYEIFSMLYDVEKNKGILTSSKYYPLITNERCNFTFEL